MVPETGIDHFGTSLPYQIGRSRAACEVLREPAGWEERWLFYGKKEGCGRLLAFWDSSPIVGNGSLVSATRSGSNLTLRWLQLESDGTYTLTHSTILGGSWTALASPVPALDANQTGAPADYDYYNVTLPVAPGRNFFRIEGTEN
jgi:hypothetical protein